MIGGAGGLQLPGIAALDRTWILRPPVKAAQKILPKETLHPPYPEELLLRKSDKKRK